MENPNLGVSRRLDIYIGFPKQDKDKDKTYVDFKGNIKTFALE